MSGYVGKLAQTGTQTVKAPNQLATPAKSGKVQKGSDMRTRGK